MFVVVDVLVLSKRGGRMSPLTCTTISSDQFPLVRSCFSSILVQAEERDGDRYCIVNPLEDYFFDRLRQSVSRQGGKHQIEVAV